MDTPLFDYPAFAKLKFNERQVDFWSEDAARLRTARNALDDLSPFDPRTREAALKAGFFPKRRTDDPKVPANKMPVDEINKYRAVAESCIRARTILIAKAGGRKPNAQTDGYHVCVDDNDYALRQVKCHRTLKSFKVPEIIYQAAKNDDWAFFKALARVLESKEKMQDVDWSRCDKLDCFLVDYWCGADPRFYLRLPPLCFLTEETLAVVCSYAVKGDEIDLATEDSQTSENAIKKRRRRLGLMPAKHPKIGGRQCRDGSILFEIRVAA